MPVSQPWHQRFWEGFKATFKNLVVIRYHSTASSPILPPEQRDWIRENMAFTLALAQWAALREQPQLYKHSLEQVRQGLIANYPDNAERKKILDRVAELMAIDIAPTPPDINASLRAVQQALKELPPEPAAPSIIQPTLPQTNPRQRADPTTGKNATASIGSGNLNHGQTIHHFFIITRRGLDRLGDTSGFGLRADYLRTMGN